MTPREPADQLEARRRLAVTRVEEGWKQKGVAAFSGVSPGAVSNWVAAHKAGGDDGLASKPHPGARPKLSRRRERAVLSLLARKPQAFGCATDLWATRGLADVEPKERKNPAIARRVAEDWSRIQNN